MDPTRWIKDMKRGRGTERGRVCETKWCRISRFTNSTQDSSATTNHNNDNDVFCNNDVLNDVLASLRIWPILKKAKTICYCFDRGSKRTRVRAPENPCVCARTKGEKIISGVYILVREFWTGLQYLFLKYGSKNDSNKINSVKVSFFNWFSSINQKCLFSFWW